MRRVEGRECVNLGGAMGDELDELLRDRFDLSRADVVAALKRLPPLRPGATTLTADQAQLLDDVGFTENPQAYTEAAVDVVTRLARLISTAYTAAQVAVASISHRRDGSISLRWLRRPRPPSG
jgi:hypothetical protein